MPRTAPSNLRANAISKLKALTRQRYSLGADDVVLVAELACGLPGCPPLETCVTFWTQETTRHQFKVFKPVTEVIADDLPPYWMKGALARDMDPACC